MFIVPQSLDALADVHWFDHPFPSDFRRESDGTARFAGFPNPRQMPILDNYVGALAHLLDGFSPVAATYLRFTGPIDPSTLPKDPPSAAASDASVFILDVDPSSPEHGKRRLASMEWRADEGVYWQPNTLAVMPMVGEPLRPKTKYAVVVTSRVRAGDGSAITPTDELSEALGTKPATDATRPLHDLFAPAVADLQAAGVQASDVVHMTVFTTNDPTAETFAVIDDVTNSVPAPTASMWTQKEQTGTYDVYEGLYGPSPNYQQGNVPYRQPADGGGFVFVNGKPQLQNTFVPRFSLVVPNATACPPPAGGYPVVLYAHGTGGDYRSFIEDGTAGALAQQCLAGMGIDQIFHGTRPGAPPADDPNRETNIELIFFNLDNPAAARTNNRQSSVDVVQQARLFTDTHVTVPASVSRTMQDIAFDSSKLMFFGHSQGGLNGPLFLAGSDKARGAVLSGAGSVLAIALLEKKAPVDVSAAIRLLVGLGSPDDAAELDIFHPVMCVTQSIVDATDTIHYGKYITRAPRDGHTPKSIYQTEGINADGTGDTYAPPHGIEALSVAIGLPRQAPGIKPIQEAQWDGIQDVTVPSDGVSGDLASGMASGVLAQWPPKVGSDGHFVVFDIPAARTQAAKFLSNLAADPKGRVPAP
ncbi:MAG TPA: hypothetical protein VIF62_32385 [Labilithrix sp.]